MAVQPLVIPATFSRQRTLLGHPIGLYVLFFTEMWERFSYYGMRGLLMLYMVNYFKWDQRQASGIYKWYTSLVYLTPLLGGYLADRFLGNKRAVIIGAILMAIGHFLMAFEPVTIFFLALAFLIFGNGFFKPNMSTQVGRLYPANDSRRDGAYTIFYMGINLGAFLSPLVCGWLAASPNFGYHYGFGAAGVGMVLGLCIYLFGLPLVREIDPNAVASDATVSPNSRKDVSEAIASGAPPRKDTSEAISSGPPPLDDTSEAVVGKRQEDMMGRADMVEPHRPVLTEAECERIPSALPFLNRAMVNVLMAAGIIIAVAAPILAVTKVRTFFDMVFFELIAICAFMAALILRNVRNAVRDRVLAVYALFIFVVIFWGGFEQAGNVLNVWADQSTNRYLWTEPSPPPLKEGEPEAAADGLIAGVLNPVPTVWFQSVNALAIFMLAPLFAWLWTFLDRRGINPSIPFKMGLGVLFLSASFALMIGAARSENQKSTWPLAELPASTPLDAENHLCHLEKDGKAGEPFVAGRLNFDRTTKSLILYGALPIVERDRILAQTARSKISSRPSKNSEKNPPKPVRATG